MRKFISIIWILLFALGITAQTTTDNLSIERPEGSLFVKWSGVNIDSAETLWSQSFTMYEFDGYNTSAQLLSTTTISTADTIYAAADTTYSSTTATTNVYGDAVKPWFYHRVDLDAGSTTAKVNFYHYVNYIHPDSLSDWIVSDTLATVTAETAAKLEVDLNNTKAPWHKIKAVVPATGQAATFNAGLYIPKKE